MSARSSPELFLRPTGLLLFSLAMLVACVVIGHTSYRTLLINDSAYELRVADTEAARAKGLGGRNSLLLNQGMVFVYHPPRQACFWMKDMRFSLDIIWLTADKVVADVVPDASPKSYPHTFCPSQPAAYVIELQGGEAAKQGIRPGTQLSF